MYGWINANEYDVWDDEKFYDNRRDTIPHACHSICDTSRCSCKNPQGAEVQKEIVE